MRISTKGRYAIKLMLDLATNDNGEPIRLKDVARIELGASSYTYIGEVNGHPGSNCMIAQTSGSNANEIIKEIDKVTAEIAQGLPKGMELVD